MLELVYLCQDMLYCTRYNHVKNKETNEMDAYTGFASVYDTFMDNVPYEEWAEYLHGLLLEWGVSEGPLVDLGCGTGSMTGILAAKGYEMTGVDNSEEMLGIAVEKWAESEYKILFILQDMRELELGETVKAVFSVCDSVNYITESKELAEVFARVNKYLDPGGIFIFDFNTEYKYREVLGDRTIAESREDCSFIWDNYYYEEEKINEYELSLFIKDDSIEGERENVYRKYEEIHYQRGYSLEEMRHLVEQGGMEFVAAYDAFTKKPPAHTSERLYVIAREQGK